MSVSLNVTNFSQSQENLNVSDIDYSIKLSYNFKLSKYLHPIGAPSKIQQVRIRMIFMLQEVKSTHSFDCLDSLLAGWCCLSLSLSRYLWKQQVTNKLMHHLHPFNTAAEVI